MSPKIGGQIKCAVLFDIRQCSFCCCFDCHHLLLSSFAVAIIWKFPFIYLFILFNDYAVVNPSLMAIMHAQHHKDRNNTQIRWQCFNSGFWNATCERVSFFSVRVCISDASSIIFCCAVEKFLCVTELENTSSFCRKLSLLCKHFDIYYVLFGFLLCSSFSIQLA